MVKTYPTKIEVMQMIDNLKLNGCKIWCIESIIEHISQNRPNPLAGQSLKVDLSGAEIFKMSIDDMVSFLADKSLTHAVYMIKSWDRHDEVYSLILAETEDGTTNLDFDLIEHIANFIFAWL